MKLSQNKRVIIYFAILSSFFRLKVREFNLKNQHSNLQKVQLVQLLFQLQEIPNIIHNI